MILYLHGFRSSPHSFKARLLAERMQALGRGAEYFCPHMDEVLAFCGIDSAAPR